MTKTIPYKSYTDIRKAQSNSTMLYVGDSKTAFRCECGANVFQKIKDSEGIGYSCNGCKLVYRESK